MNASADSAGPGYDVFVSYAHADCAAVGALVAALRAGGLKVWFDESEIPAFAAIAQRIAQGLAQSKAFLAYYSKTYPTRRGCQYELMTAFVAAQAATRGLERLLVVNPESSDVHIQPINLHNTKYLSGPTTSEALTAGSAAISAHLSTLVGSFGPPAALTPPQWYPSRGIGSTRFVGRVEQMWEIHSRLNDDTAPFAASRDTAGVAQITGLGGVGKSLLAEEYALRFGAAYPGGIYWLRALGSDATGESSLARLEAARIDQYSVIGAQLQLLPGNSPADLEGQLRYHFQNRGKRGLWVVDDMPAGLPVDTLRSWFAPHPLLKTLFTTRSREYTAIAAEVALGVLPEDDAYALLTSRVKSSGAAEESAARATIQALGAHALALDVAAAALTNYEGTTSFQDFARELEIPDADSLELAANLADTLPNGHEKSIATTLLGAIRSASEPARDVLRLASLLAAAPIPEPLLIVIPAGPRGQSGPQGGWSEADASMKFRLAVRDLQRYALADRQEAGFWLVHPLITRVMRYKFGREPRTEALRASALNVFGSWLADRRSRDLSAGAELSHARKLASAGSGLQELYLLQLVASLDERRGAYSSAEAEWRTALLRLEQVPHTEQTRLAIQGNLAVTLRKAGDALQARDLQTKVLERRTELLGPKHAETIESLDNLGVTLAALGDFAGAISRHEQAVSLYSEVRGPGDPDTLVAMANLASALRRGGRVKEALELNTKLLELRAKVLGPNHPGTLCAAEGLAVSLSELGQPTQALPLLKAAAEGLEQVRGPDDPTTLSVRHNLGRALIETGQGQEGHALAAEVFDRQERVLGLSHPDTLLTLETCVFAGREPGHLVYDPRFKSKAAEALKALSSSMGPKHPRTTACAWDLYLMLESDPNRRTETVALVDSYLAWLLTTPPQELEASQRTILGQFARTEDGLFRLVVARLSPGGKT